MGSNESSVWQLCVSESCCGQNWWRESRPPRLCRRRCHRRGPRRCAAAHKQVALKTQPFFFRVVKKSSMAYVIKPSDTKEKHGMNPETVFHGGKRGLWAAWSTSASDGNEHELFKQMSIQMSFLLHIRLSIFSGPLDIKTLPLTHP